MNPSFDSGIFLCMLIIGFVTLIYSKKFGGIIVIPSIFCFFISGLLILTGYDVSSFTQTITPSGAINQTSYFIGNGSSPNGTGQLWMGYALIALTIISTAIFIDLAMKGKIFDADSGNKKQ